MKVLITGGLGFIGTQLSLRLLQKGHEITVVDRSPGRKPRAPAEVRVIAADTARPGPWQEALARQDAVINLAGTSIFRRWTDEAKKAIRESRILATRNLVDAFPEGAGRVLVSASAVGYYGPRGDETLTEEAAPGNDFLATLCREWEGEAMEAASKGARVVITRFGIVLGKTGGALGQMIPAFKRFAGGPLGSGRQWFSWIHMEDLLGAMEFVLEKEAIRGPANFTAPNPVRNNDLALLLGRLLHRPSRLRTPGFLLRLAMGEFGSVLLEGQRVIPAALLRHGYAFRYPDIEAALRDVLERS
ncbi:TIGR01777 family oxidoreductase [Desulfoglaeba alkanexedens]|uniref:TIGR01777 family protein n=1 Tax=Desulfoglaeba alkanexedens ALDC TaxID=980445 RepID=A0A4P8KZS0_9BACT|nr:TIGR01777 family oxidoreductase [Desulfoglaeba alkanexedens]QCQ20910.1 TIGR01777 family protein [Desulfoglaeba alkanexedens ALDC]